MASIPLLTHISVQMCVNAHVTVWFCIITCTSYFFYVYMPSLSMKFLKLNSQIMATSQYLH